MQCNVGCDLGLTWRVSSQACSRNNAARRSSLLLKSLEICNIISDKNGLTKPMTG